MTKERLKEYKKLAGEITELKERIQVLEAKCEGGSMVINDMPKGGKAPDYLCRLGDAVRKLVILKSNLQSEMVAIEDWIEGIPDSTVRTIFRYRYLQGSKWEDIANKMNYNRRYIIKIHDKHIKKSL